MQYLTDDEARAWATFRGFRIDESFRFPLDGGITAPLRFHIPANAGARVALARVLWEAAGAGAPEVLLWVTGWGIWPSADHRPLTEAVRRGFGAERTLAETPGHLTRLGEDDAALSVLCLAVLFLWDCWVLPTGRRPAIFVSHDEFGIVHVREDDCGLASRLVALGVADDSDSAINHSIADGRLTYPASL